MLVTGGLVVEDVEKFIPSRDNVETVDLTEPFVEHAQPSVELTEPPHDHSPGSIWAGYVAVNGEAGWQPGYEGLMRLRYSRYTEDDTGYFCHAKLRDIERRGGMEIDPWDQAAASFAIAVNEEGREWKVLAGFRTIDPARSLTDVDYEEVAQQYPELGLPDEIQAGIPAASALDQSLRAQHGTSLQQALDEQDIVFGTHTDRMRHLLTRPEISRFVSCGVEAVRYPIRAPLAGAIAGSFAGHDGLDNSVALTDKGILIYGKRVGVPVEDVTPEIYIPVFRSKNFIMELGQPDPNARRGATTHYFSKLVAQQESQEFAEAVRKLCIEKEVRLESANA